jgi:hypothetical protein
MKNAVLYVIPKPTTDNLATLRDNKTAWKKVGEVIIAA